MSVTAEELQRYHDDELGPAERAHVEAGLSDEDRERLAALAEMRALINASLEREAAEIDLWSGVRASLDEQAAKQARVRRWRDRVRSRVASAGLLVAAVAALLLVVRPWHPRHADDDCDVETLEVDGALATVFQMSDVPHAGEGGATVIWMEEN